MEHFREISRTTIGRYNLLVTAVSDDPEGRPERVLFHRGDSVACLPYDPLRERILLIRQYRAPLSYNVEDDPYLLEVPAGSMDKGNELPYMTMIRELEEEAGIIVNDALPSYGYMYPSPGACTERIYLYSCEYRGPLKQKTGGIGHEKLDLIELSYEEARMKLELGEIIDAKTALLLWPFLLNQHNIEQLND